MSLSRAQLARNNLGGKVRSGDRAAAAAARAELKAANLRAGIRAAVSTWPPLTPEVRSELAVLLLTPAGDGDAA